MKTTKQENMKAYPILQPQSCLQCCCKTMHVLFMNKIMGFVLVPFFLVLCFQCLLSILLWSLHLFLISTVPWYSSKNGTIFMWYYNTDVTVSGIWSTIIDEFLIIVMLIMLHLLLHVVQVVIMAMVHLQHFFVYNNYLFFS